MRALIALSLIATSAVAQPTEGKEKLPLWEAGVFGIVGSQQAYPGSKQQVRSGIVLPFLIYRGDWLRAEQGGVGIRALRSASTEIDIGFAGSFGSAPRDNDARRGMPRIGTLAEFGPRVKWDLGPGPGGGRWRAAVPLRAVLDVSHAFDYRGIAFEPDIGWGARTAGGWGYGVNLGLMVGHAAPGRHLLRRGARVRHAHAPAVRSEGRAHRHAPHLQPGYRARARLALLRIRAPGHREGRRQPQQPAGGQAHRRLGGRGAGVDGMAFRQPGDTVMNKAWFDGFELRDFDLDGARVHARIGGREGAPPLLLLHGFPQTHAMWHLVAPNCSHRTFSPRDAGSAWVR